MSYAKSDLGKLYTVTFSPAIGPDFNVKINVPLEQLTSDIGEMVGSAAAPRLKAVFEKNLPYFKDKAVAASPAVVDAVVNALRKRRKDLESLVEKTTKPVAKRTGFYVALGVVAAITALAIVQKRTQ